MAQSSTGECIRGDESMTVIAERVEAFLRAWESGTAPPDPVHFLPEPESLRRGTLVELLKVDLEQRWLVRCEPKRLEDYLREFPELAAGGVPADLIYEEFHVRRQAGLAVDPQEYLDAWPAQADELLCLLNVEQPYVSTAICRADTQRRLEELQPGETIDDFELLTLLGRGAFASVFLARQNSMQRLLALKVSADEGAEPQTLARLDHEHIVRVFDQRMLPERSLRLLYMQYLPGGTLQSVLQERRRTPPAEHAGSILLRAVDRALEDRGEVRPAESALRARLRREDWGRTVCWIGACLARALDYAHRRDVLHRDIKPANVLLDAEGVPRLADFNIGFSSKVQGVRAETHFGGSLAYMSPEQLEAFSPRCDRRPDSLDGRSDLYSLGVVLWELLTGRRPFRDEPTGEKLADLDAMIARRREDLPDDAFEDLPADTPPGLLAVLEKCLAPDPAERWPSGAELARRLELCLKPRAHDLLVPPSESRRVTFRRYSIAVVLLGALIPNALAGVFNWFYDKGIVPEEAREAFDTLVLIINSTAYPLGLAILAWLAWPVARAMAAVESSGKCNAPLNLRRRALNLGRLAALVGVVEWTLAALAYPISLHVFSGEMPQYPHWFGSLLLCGLIAATYPFFGITLYSVRVLYPAMLAAAVPDEEDRRILSGLKRRTWAYFLLSFAVPMLGVLALIFIDSDRPEHKLALKILGCAGLAGCLLIYSAFFRPLQNDLDALIEALEPQ